MSEPYLIGVGLKMYLGYHQTIQWVERIAEIAKHHEAATSGAAELFVLPGFPALVSTREALQGTTIRIGAQDLFWEDRGAYTGEVSGSNLAEIGCSYVEVGHAERRRIFHETEDVVAKKMAAAFRNGLTPVLCVGETERCAPGDAAVECLRQLESALAHSRGEGSAARLVLAYEPQWAIGAEQPADADHIRTVTEHCRNGMEADAASAGSRIIYGGSAGPGMLGSLAGAVDGLFLGRSAHEPETFRAVLTEVQALRA